MILIFIMYQMTSYSEWIKSNHISVEDNIKITEIIDIEWYLQTDDTIQPRVIVKPQYLYGTQITTVFTNAEYIYENKLGPGAIITISRKMEFLSRPYILGTIKPSDSGEAQMPLYSYKWDDYGIKFVAVATQNEQQEDEECEENEEFEFIITI